MTKTYTILIRRDSVQMWYRYNPILALGELGYDYTNKVIKIGDGQTRWRELKGILEVQI